MGKIGKLVADQTKYNFFNIYLLFFIVEWLCKFQVEVEYDFINLIIGPSEED